MNNSNVCCFSGHRFLGPDFDKNSLEKAVLKMIENGVDTFICGGAIGFDTVCAKYIVELKKKNPNLKLWIFAPCKDQDARWKLSDRIMYRLILRKADLVDMPMYKYHDGCMKERNYRMVDNSANCICFFDGSMKSGTGQTVRYAIRKNINVVNLYDEDIDMD